MHCMQPLRNFKDKKQTIKGMTNDSLDLGFNGPIESQVQAASYFYGNIWIKVLRSREKSSNEICPTGKSPKRESSTDTLPVKCLNTSKAMVLEFNCSIEIVFRF